MLAHLGSKRPPTHPSCFVRGALHVGGAGSAHFVCALCVRILTVGGWVGGWGWGAPRGGGGTLNIRLFGNFSGFLPYPGPSRPPAAGPPPPTPPPAPPPPDWPHQSVFPAPQGAATQPHHQNRGARVGDPSTQGKHSRKNNRKRIPKEKIKLEKLN